MTLLEATERTARELKLYEANPDLFLEHLIELRAICMLDKPDSLAQKHLRRATELLSDATTDLETGLGLAEVNQALHALRPPKSKKVQRSMAELRALGVGEAQIAKILKDREPLWTLPDEPKPTEDPKQESDMPPEVKRDILEGVPLRAIAANHNIDVETVKEYAKELNEDVCESAGQLSPRLKSEAIAMYEADTSLDYATIAKKLSTSERICPENRVRDALIEHIRAKEAGVTSEAEPLNLTKDEYETTLSEYREGIPVTEETDQFLAELAKKTRKKGRKGKNPETKE